MTVADLPWAPRDYVALPDMPKHWRVVDVGPGAYPLKRANLCIDRDPEILAPISEQGIATLQDDINKGYQSIPDKSFDYVWCSHVLEHVDDPEACARTLSRIGKSGTIVMPSVYKEALGLFEESTHQWDILPHPSGHAPIFVRRSRDFVYPLEDELASQALSFLFRTGSNHDCTAEIHLRTWFQYKEKYLDVVYHWTNELKLTVIA